MRTRTVATTAFALLFGCGDASEDREASQTSETGSSGTSSTTIGSTAASSATAAVSATSSSTDSSTDSSTGRTTSGTSSGTGADSSTSLEEGSSGSSTSGSTSNCVAVDLAWTETAPLPELIGQGGRAAILGGRIYVAGGLASQPNAVASPLVYAADIDSADGELTTWEAQVPLPMPGGAQQLVEAGGHLWAVGIPDSVLGQFGLPPGQFSWRAELLDGDIVGWVVDVTVFPAPFVTGFSAFGTNDHIYIAGGISLLGQPPSSAVNYAQVREDGTLSPWVRAASLPSPLLAAGAAVADGDVFLVSGVDPTPGTPGTRSYTATLGDDGSPGSWSSAVSPLPFEQFSPAVVRAGERTLALGGIFVEQNTQQITAVADATFSTTDGVTWSEETPLPLPRSDASAAANAQFVFVVGGEAGQIPSTVDTTSVLVSRHCDFVR